MYAITLKTFGEPDVLTLTEVPTPKPNASELLVHVNAAGVNRADLLQRRGKYPPPKDASDILGLEMAGEVAAIGKDVTNFKIGDRVCGLVSGGGYAEFCVIDHLVAMPIPASLSFVEAAAIPEAFLTAQQALFTLGNLQAEESVLIHAGASGVGSAAIQLAKISDAIVFTTVGSQEKAEKIKSLHPDKIIIHKEKNFADAIDQVNVIIDFIGAPYLSSHLSILKIAGRLVCVGLMGGTKTEIDLGEVVHKRLQIKGLVMRSRTLFDKREISQHFCKKWLPLFETKKLKSIIDSVFPLADARLAHERMETNQNVGKIILTI